MASVVIQKRKRKNGTSYVITYRDPLTFRSKYHKTCKRYKDAQREANELRDLLDNGGVPQSQVSKKMIRNTIHLRRYTLIIVLLY